MQSGIGSSSLIWLLLRTSIFIVDLVDEGQITPKGESTNTTRTEWLTSFSSYLASVSIKLQKSAISTTDRVLAHSLPKEGHGGSKLKKGLGMKKGLVSIFVLLVLTFTAIPAGAQTRYRRYDSRRYEQRYDNRTSSGRRYQWDQDRSFWDRHRDKLTTGIGAGAGAVVGGTVGGKKGALIGSLLGAGGAALYTYKLRDRNNWRGRRY